MSFEGLPRTRSEDVNVLSGIVSEAVRTYLERLQHTGYPLPTLENPIPEVVKVTTAQDAKFEIMRNIAFHEPACVAIVIDLNVPEDVAPGPIPTSLDQLAEVTGDSSELIERVMRVCTSRLCFNAIAPGQYTQNGISLSMLIPPIGALIGHCTEDALLTGSKLLDTLREGKCQISGDPDEAAFKKLAEVDPQRLERFALGMAGSELNRPLTGEVYPFEKLAEGAKIVDIGGGRGQVSIRIAEKVSHLSFVVQDQASVVESVLAEGGLDEMNDRVKFQPRDFFTTQSVKGADAYLFRFILHDHPDSACVTILRQIVLAMDPVKSRILIDNAIVPGFLGPESLRIFNLLDMYMLGNLNGKERTKKQWRELFKTTDTRLVTDNIWEEKNGGRPGGRVIELRLKTTKPNGMSGFHHEASKNVTESNTEDGVHEELSEKPAAEQVGVNEIDRVLSEESNETTGMQPEVSMMEQRWE